MDKIEAKSRFSDQQQKKKTGQERGQAQFSFKKLPARGIAKWAVPEIQGLAPQG